MLWVYTQGYGYMFYRHVSRQLLRLVWDIKVRLCPSAMGKECEVSGFVD